MSSCGRRSVLKSMLAAGALPAFNIGCAGFGRGRGAQLASGAKTRIAIIGCGDWGRTLLNRAGLVGGCELVALCEPDPSAVGVLYAKCAKVWGRDALVKAEVFYDYREMFAKLGDGLDFSVPLAKTLMLANMLAFAGKGAYSFDGEKTDSAVANAHASRPYRRGWEVA